MSSVNPQPQSIPQDIFLSPQEMLHMPQENLQLPNSIPISQQTYPPSQPQQQLPDNIDPSNLI